jgi:hypothetical protein
MLNHPNYEEWEFSAMRWHFAWWYKRVFRLTAPLLGNLQITDLAPRTRARMTVLWQDSAALAETTRWEIRSELQRRLHGETIGGCHPVLGDLFSNTIRTINEK